MKKKGNEGRLDGGRGWERGKLGMKERGENWWRGF